MEYETAILYQNSDNYIDIRCLDQNGVYEPASTFTDAEYILGTTSGKVKIRLTLGNGISVITKDSESLFRLHIDDSMITFLGTFRDQFLTYDALGNKGKPRFIRKVKIEKVLTV